MPSSFRDKYAKKYNKRIKREQMKTNVFGEIGRVGGLLGCLLVCPNCLGFVQERHEILVVGSKADRQRFDSLRYKIKQFVVH